MPWYGGPWGGPLLHRCGCRRGHAAQKGEEEIVGQLCQGIGGAFCILDCCTKLRCLIRQIKLDTPKFTLDKIVLQSGCRMKGEVRVVNTAQSVSTVIAINTMRRIGGQKRHRPAA